MDIGCYRDAKGMPAFGTKGLEVGQHIGFTKFLSTGRWKLQKLRK
jgi:hypothetical protein